MPIIKEIIRTETNNSLSFGDYSLAEKKKVEDYDFNGGLYKVKTYKELTKLERDGLFVYESEPGTAVSDFSETEAGVEFTVCGPEDAQITIGLSEDTEYDVTVNGKEIGKMKTNLSGKLSLSVNLKDEGEITVKVVK